MRVRKHLIIVTFILFFCFLLPKNASAECGGSLECDSCSGCGGTQSCTTYGTFNTSQCTGTCIDITCWDNIDQNPTGSWTDRDGRTYWSPGGYPDTVCVSICKTGCTSDQSCISETYTRTCSPAGCGGPDPPPGSDPTSTPPPSSSVLLVGNVQQDIDAVASGTYCSQTESVPLNSNGYTIGVTNTAAPSTVYNTAYTGDGWYVNTQSTGSTYTVTLDLSNQGGEINYACSCPAALDPNNPYVCRYTGVSSPSNQVNFYLKEYNLSNQSWFQVFGGNLFGRYGVESNISYTFCALYDNCQAALNVPLAGSNNQLSSGFAIANTSSANSVSSSNIEGYGHSFFHLAEREENTNSYAVGTDLNQLNYSYFHNLAKDEIQEIGDGEDLEPLLSDWTNSPWWRGDETNFVEVHGNVNIDETQGFNLTDGQSLVVFVNGRLILDDSDTSNGDLNKITSVATGSFLAFFVSEDIIITADVGYELNPLNPTVPVVSNTNSNLEGVFVADRDLIIQSKTAIGEVPPDRKFIGSGTFVGWRDVQLQRTFDDNSFGAILNNNQAVENFIYRPDFLVNWPVKLKASTNHWREVNPQLISQ